VGFCFEALFKIDIIMQSEFEFDGWLENYNFLSFEIACMCPLPLMINTALHLVRGSQDL